MLLFNWFGVPDLVRSWRDWFEFRTALRRIWVSWNLSIRGEEFEDSIHFFKFAAVSSDFLYALISRFKICCKHVHCPVTENSPVQLGAQLFMANFALVDLIWHRRSASLCFWFQLVRSGGSVWDLVLVWRFRSPLVAHFLLSSFLKFEHFWRMF